MWFHFLRLFFSAEILFTLVTFAGSNLSLSYNKMSFKRFPLTIVLHIKYIVNILISSSKMILTFFVQITLEKEHKILFDLKPRHTFLITSYNVITIFCHSLLCIVYLKVDEWLKKALFSLKL